MTRDDTTDLLKHVDVTRDTTDLLKHVDVTRDTTDLKHVDVTHV